MKSFFRTIRDFLRPKRPDNYLPKLTEGEVSRLRQLAASDGWPVFIRLLDNQSTLYGEALLSSSDADALQFYRGVILGMRKAGTLVDETIRKEQEIVEHERSRSDRGEPSALQRAAALGWSPAWGDHDT